MRTWKDCFGEETSVNDFAGYEMNKANYGQPGKGGWNIHHLIPKSMGGKDSIDNLMLMSMEVHKHIGSRTTFTIDDVRYQVKWCKADKRYKLYHHQ